MCRQQLNNLLWGKTSTKSHKFCSKKTVRERPVGESGHKIKEYFPYDSERKTSQSLLLSIFFFFSPWLQSADIKKESEIRLCSLYSVVMLSRFVSFRFQLVFFFKKNINFPLGLCLDSCFLPFEIKLTCLRWYDIISHLADR